MKKGRGEKKKKRKKKGGKRERRDGGTRGGPFLILCSSPTCKDKRNERRKEKKGRKGITPERKRGEVQSLAHFSALLQSPLILPSRERGKKKKEKRGKFLNLAKREERKGNTVLASPSFPVLTFILTLVPNRRKGKKGGGKGKKKKKGAEGKKEKGGWEGGRLKGRPVLGEHHNVFINIVLA